MKKFYPGIIMFLLVLLVFILTSKANGFYTQVGKDGNETVSENSESQTHGTSSMYAVDAEFIQPIGSASIKPLDNIVVHMNAPGGENMAIIRCLLGADENAESLKISIRVQGRGRLSVMFANQTDDKILGTHFDINGNDGLCVFYIMPASRYVNDDELVEIHITVSDGQTLDIGAITVESLVKKPVETKIIKTYNYYPPDYENHQSIFYAYYTGPYYVSRYGYDCSYVVYDNWWTLPGYCSWRVIYEPIYVVHPVRTIYYCAQSDIYYNANCASVSYRDDNGYFAPSKIVKVSERRRIAQEGRASQRIRSVDGNGQKRDFRGNVNGNVAKGEVSTESIERNQAKLDRVKNRSQLSQKDSRTYGSTGIDVVEKRSGMQIQPKQEQAQQQKPSKKNFGTRLSNAVQRTAKSAAERVFVITPRNDSGVMANNSSQKRMPTREVRQQPTRTQSVQPVQQDQAKQAPAPARTETHQVVKQESFSTKQSPSSSTDDDEHKKKRRDR